MSDTGGAVSGGEASGGESTGQESSSGQQSAQGQSAQGQVAANQPTKSELKELGADSMDQLVTMKVNGQIQKMTVRQALKQAELGVGAQQRMQEAAKDRKEAQRLMTLARNDPDKFFQETGVDPDQYAEKRLVSKYEKMSMTPEQRKMAEMQEQLQNYKNVETQSKQNLLAELKGILNEVPEGLENLSKEELGQQVQRARAIYQEQVQNIEKEFIDAWKGTGLPKHPIFGQWTASLMHASQVQKNSGQREDSLKAADAASIVKENFIKAVQEITGSLDASQLHQLLGPDTMKALREFDVQRVTSKSVPSHEQSKSPGQRPASGSKNNKTVNESGWKAVFNNIK